MIVGDVKPNLDTLITLAVAGPTNRKVEVEAVIDTGFTDYLTLGRDTVTHLGLRFRESMVYELVNNEFEMLDLYECRVLWDGHWRRVLASAAEGGSLVGMGLMKGFHLGIDIVDGGRVELRRLPR